MAVLYSSKSIFNDQLVHTVELFHSVEGHASKRAARNLANALKQYLPYIACEVVHEAWDVHRYTMGQLAERARVVAPIDGGSRQHISSYAIESEKLEREVRVVNVATRASVVALDPAHGCRRHLDPLDLDAALHNFFAVWPDAEAVQALRALRTCALASSRSGIPDIDGRASAAFLARAAADIDINFETRDALEGRPVGVSAALLDYGRLVEAAFAARIPA